MKNNKVISYYSFKHLKALIFVLLCLPTIALANNGFKRADSDDLFTYFIKLSDAKKAVRWGLENNTDRAINVGSLSVAYQCRQSSTQRKHYLSRIIKPGEKASFVGFDFVCEDKISNWKVLNVDFKVENMYGNHLKCPGSRDKLSYEVKKLSDSALQFAFVGKGTATVNGLKRDIDGRPVVDFDFSSVYEMACGSLDDNSSKAQQKVIKSLQNYSKKFLNKFECSGDDKCFNSIELKDGWAGLRG
jgi:hypothetical protein